MSPQRGSIDRIGACVPLPLCFGQLVDSAAIGHIEVCKHAAIGEVATAQAPSPSARSPRQPQAQVSPPVPLSPFPSVLASVLFWVGFPLRSGAARSLSVRCKSQLWWRTCQEIGGVIGVTGHAIGCTGAEGAVADLLGPSYPDIGRPWRDGGVEAPSWDPLQRHIIGLRHSGAIQRRN